MKGLLIKDILNLKNYMKQLIVVLIFFIAYGIFLKNGVFVGSMIALMLGMQVITTLSYDEYAKWDKYALTMNINRKDVILSKYAFFIISILVSIIVGLIISISINQVANLGTSMEEMLITSTLVPCLFAVLFSIVIPVIFKVGVEKARIVMMAIFFIPAIIVFLGAKLIGKSNFQMPDEVTLEMIAKFGAVGLVILAVVAIFISYKVSLSIYNKKEF
ncbi:ABC-2 transporter permease [Intestinibacter sp.]